MRTIPLLIIIYSLYVNGVAVNYKHILIRSTDLESSHRLLISLQSMQFIYGLLVSLSVADACEFYECNIHYIGF